MKHLNSEQIFGIIMLICVTLMSIILFIFEKGFAKHFLYTLVSIGLIFCFCLGGYFLLNKEPD